MEAFKFFNQTEKYGYMRVISSNYSIHYVNSKICVYKISHEDHEEIVSPKQKLELFGIERLVCAKPQACDTLRYT